MAPVVFWGGRAALWLYGLFTSAEVGTAVTVTGVATAAVGTAAITNEIINANNVANESSEEEAAPIADACSTCSPPMPPKCQDQADKFKNRRDELEKRNNDLYNDKQSNLRKLITEYRILGCPDAGIGDADKWSTISPRNRPGK